MACSPTWPIEDSVEVSRIWRELLEIGALEDIDVQREWRDRVHREDLVRVLTAVDGCVASDRERDRVEYRLRSRDGTRWKWIQADISIRDRDLTGRVTRLIGAMTDITERKTLEEDLRASTAQIQSSFDSAPIGKAIVARPPDLSKVRAGTCCRKYVHLLLSCRRYYLVFRSDSIKA